MSNGDSLDGFVFPPFVPSASTRPAQAPPSAPPAPVQEPAQPPEPEDASGRLSMPWDLETPIVRESDEVAASAAVDDDEEDLPWLEIPAPRDAMDAPAETPAAPAQDDAFPDWLAWDQRDEDAAESDARDTVAPIAGLEEFIPDAGLGRVAPAPAVEWAEAEPSGAAGAADDAFPDFTLDEAPAAAPSPADWSLSTPEAAEPPSVTEAPLPTWEESPGAPSYDVSLDEDAAAFVIEPAEVAEAEEPVAAAEPRPFVADTEAVIAAEPPLAGEAAGPDPFTAASVAEAEVVAPAEGVPGPFDDVAARLEAIARMLRERPDELLAGGSSDPLALLVTGYVMGYTARGR